jgi:peptide/nickel transport system permease protein
MITAQSSETTTVATTAPTRKAKRFNRFDSPWFNSRLIIGFIMLTLVILLGLIGPLFWDTRLALVSSSPLNLPPAWIKNETPTPAAAAATAVATSDTTGGFGSGGLGGSGLAESLMQSTPAPGRDTSQDVGTGIRTGDPAHPLGTDDQGRDMLALVIVGAPAALKVGIIAASFGMLLGIILGFAAGFLGGWVDTIVRIASDTAFTIPSLAVLLVISSYLKRVDVDTMALLLALFAWPGPTRLIRAQVLTLRERGYVRMARLSGVSTLTIMFREILPNLLPYLAASLVGNISGAILAATSLEALGLGPTRVPTLGMTIFYAIRGAAIFQGMWWWWSFPILVLIFMFTGLFQIATGLDEIANPRLRGAKAQ